MAIFLGFEWGVDDDEEKFCSFLLAVVLDFIGDLRDQFTDDVVMFVVFFTGNLPFLGGATAFCPFLVRVLLCAEDFLSSLSWFFADWRSNYDYDC